MIGNLNKKKSKVQQNPATMKSFNPATGAVVGEYKLNSVEDVRIDAEKAKKAQIEWAAMPLKKRISHIMKIRTYIINNLDVLAETISNDNGKTKVDAMGTEVLTSAMALTYYCKNAGRFLKDTKPAIGNIMFINKRSRIRREPFGVVGIISPWNYPFAIPFSEIIMALLAGNAVLCKTANETQAVGHALKKCIDAAELPENLFNYLNLPGTLAGDAFLEAGIDKLFFTGSVKVGMYLMKKASDTLTPVSLELGGNDPMIVCEDADLRRAATGAVWAGFQNAGQSCGGVERIYVQSKVYDEFLELLKKEIENLSIGYGYDFDADIGAMTTERQINTVQNHIRDALEKGAVIYAQSKLNESLKGNFLSCTVLSNVNHNMLVMKDETFGPVVGVMPYDTIEEAISFANDSYLGLTASVWSRKHGSAIKIAEKIKAGAVTINDHLMSHGLAETQWGGFKQSGIGRTHGEIGFTEMTQPQVIVNDILPFARKNFWWHPFSKKIYDGIKGVAYILYGTSIKQKLHGMADLLKAFPRTFKPN